MKKRLMAGILTAVILMWSPGSFALAGTDWLNQGTKLLDSLNSGGSSGNNTIGSVAGLSTADITAGLKQALEKGAVAVVNQLSTQNGFNLDKNIHIP
ncbi:MAG: DUF4197 domain-containing protein, partial [Desulfobacterales bacterium]|nr:DUF4197 domain-containing protein [Desulfobacterales bacterium]